jgi:hypothetical protein
MIFGDDACRLVSWLLGSGGLIGSTSGFNLNDRAPAVYPASRPLGQASVVNA